MTKNPVLNALGAALYIAIVGTLMFYGSHYIPDQPDYVLIPIAMISLFTLSAAMMGYFFLFQPVQLLVGGHKKEAVKLFVHTIGAFAAFTVLMFIIVLSNATQ